MELVQEAPGTAKDVCDLIELLSGDSDACRPVRD